MGKLAVFAVKFPSEKTVFSPGDMVSGELFVQLNEPMEMKAITIQFLGKANVRWTETHTISTGKTTTTTTRVYSANEKYFDQTIPVHGEGVDGGNSLSQGSHSFPFNFQLPTQLPSSYEDRTGHIRYQIKGTIVKPWKFDHTTKRVFTVLDSLDLNTVTNALMPGSGSETKTLCCGCCQSGPITVNFRTDRVGFVPGEWVTVNGELRNSSNSTIKETSAHIIQKVTYHATTKTKSVTNKLATVVREGCGRRSSVSMKNVKLQIPPVPPSEGKHCSIIDIQYFVQGEVTSSSILLDYLFQPNGGVSVSASRGQHREVLQDLESLIRIYLHLLCPAAYAHHALMYEAHLRTFAINLREEIPITIGTIPHRGMDVYKQTSSDLDNSHSTVPSAPPMSVAPAASPGPPPPSYAAATNEAFDITDEQDNEHTMGESTYIPQYTYYDWNQSAFTYNK